MSLWDKASHLASNLRTNLTSSGSSENEVQKLKNEIEQLNKDIEEKDKKYQSLLEKIENKEKETPLSENEYENLYKNIVT